MKTKKIILAITCVLMMVALTQSASAVTVARTGTFEWQQEDFFTITFTHGNTQTVETFDGCCVTIFGNISNGDDVRIVYTNTLSTSYVYVDGILYEVWTWIKTNIFVLPARTGSPTSRTAIDLR